MRVHYFSAAAAFVAAAVLFSGCRSEKVTAPDGATITVTATPATISSLGGVARIDVLVLRESGEAVQEETQVFLSTDLGTLDADLIRTDSSGRASTNLRATGTVGTAKVSARSGGATSGQVSVTIANESTLVFDGDSLRAEPSVIDASSSGALSTSTVRARLRRQDGTLVTGYTVLVDVGSASTAQVRLDETVVTTDSAGQVAVGVRSADQVGTAKVRLSCVSCSPATVDLELRESPGRIEISADPLAFDAGTETRTVSLLAQVFGKVKNQAMASASDVVVVFKTTGPGGFVSGANLTTSFRGAALDSGGRTSAVLSLSAADQAAAKSAGEPIAITVEATGFDGIPRTGSLAITVR
jgi:hypothetical protein